MMCMLQSASAALCVEMVSYQNELKMVFSNMAVAKYEKFDIVNLKCTVVSL